MTEPTSFKHRKLLSDVKKILDKQTEAEIENGEHFNIFSILKMTTREDRLHSRFICALLNPNGSHYKKRTFLKLFLEMLNSKHGGDEAEKKMIHDVDAFDNVERESVIGTVDHKRKTGGRIDIFLQDSISEQTICIENKIYAGDQKTQIERYRNHNRDKNHVYYLTLKGTKPDKKSNGDLKCDKDFFRLSYDEDIVTWLEGCMNIVADEPLLRESIRQYLIIIKKLTHTMNNEFKSEFTDLIIDNLEETEYLISHHKKALPKLQKNFIVAFHKELIEQLGKTDTVSTYETYSEEKVSKKFASIWIMGKKSNNPVLKFGIENFNANKEARWLGDLFIGIYPRHSRGLAFKFGENEDKPHSSWIKGQKFKYNNEVVNLGRSKFLRILNKPNSNTYNVFLQSLVSDVIKYMSDFENLMKEKYPEDFYLLQPQSIEVK